MREGLGARIARRAVTAVAAAAGAGAAWTLRDRPVLQPTRWHRRNHRGATLTLFEGPTWAAGAVAGLALAPRLTGQDRAAALLLVAGTAGIGAVDDLAETGNAKGLRGHLGALRHGEITTGALKIVGIGAAGAVAAALTTAARPGRGPVPGPVLWVADAGVSALLLAAAANLGNLLDVRPGRVIKTTLLATPALAAAGPAGAVQAAVTGAGLVTLPVDLAEQGMLGDCGANAAGALLGLEVVLGTRDRRFGWVVRAAVLAGLVGLTLASERVSFTRVIESTPVLREWDALGRRPREDQPLDDPA